MINQPVTLLIIISFITFALGFFVFYKNPKGKVNRSFALMTLASLIWINSSYFEDEFSRIGIMDFLLKIDFASASLFAFSALLFCLDVAKSGIAKRTFLRISMLVIPLALTLLIFFTKFIISGYEITQINSINPIFSNGKFIYDILIFLASFASVGMIIWKYRKSSLEEKSQFIYLFIGFFLTASIAFITNVLLTNFIQNSPNYSLYSRLGTFSVVFLILASGYAIIRHRLLNLKIITTELLSLGILVFSLFQALTSQTPSELITNVAIFIILLGFIILLVRSVENEVKQKEKVEAANKIIAKKNSQLEVANKEITERKDQLQKMSDSLAISNDQLKVANDKLKQLDEAKSAFFTRASHDLRTPITSILGFVSLIDEGSYGEVNEKQKGALEKTLTVVRRMATLVEDFLTAAKLEAGGMQYQFEKCKIENICQEIIDTFFPKAKDRGLYLDLKKPQEELPEPTIDGSRIRESISNLVDNAVKYTEKGGVTVKLEQAESSNHKPVTTNEIGEKVRGEIVGSVIRITITDTGMGIPEDGIQYLFAKFSRGKGTASVKTSGNGIGLYVCKGMIEDNGGKVWAESDGEGRGSRFIVELPINPPEEVIQKINEAKSK